MFFPVFDISSLFFHFCVMVIFLYFHFHVNIFVFFYEAYSPERFPVLTKSNKKLLITDALTYSKGRRTLQLVGFTPLCNKINIYVSFFAEQHFNTICLPFYASDNTSLRLLLTKVATAAKLFSLLMSYFKDSSQPFFGHRPLQLWRNGVSPLKQIHHLYPNL